MITKPDNVITSYLADSQNKEMVITHDGTDYDSINYYTGDIDGSLHGYVTTFNVSPYSIDLPATLDLSSNNYKEYMHDPIDDDWNYLSFYVDFMLTSIDTGMSLGTSYIFSIDFYYDESDPTKKVNKAHWYTPNNIDIYSRNTFTLQISKTDTNIENILNAYNIVLKVAIFNGTTVPSGSKVYWRMGAPRVFYSSTVNVNAVWEPAPDFNRLSRTDRDYTIDNEELLLQEFTLTESLCSQDNIKFGLCEAAHCEFSCVTSDSPKIGDKINVVSKLPGSSALSADQLILINWSLKNPLNGFDYTYTNYDPYFRVYICPDNMADWSDYIDSLNLTQYTLHTLFDLRFTFTNVTGTVPTYFKLIEEVNLNGIPAEIESGYYDVADYLFSFARISHKRNIYSDNATLRSLSRIKVKFFDSSKNTYSLNNTKCTYEVETKDWQFCIGENNATVPAFNRDEMYAATRKLNEYIYSLNNAIPLGVFYIDSVSKEYKHNLITKKITAYDNMVTLEQNAADWYTSYMFGLDSDDWTSNGFEFARQIFSSYIDYVMSIGLDSKSNYIETQIARYTYSDIASSYLSNKYKSWSSGLMVFKLRYAVFTVSDPDPTHLYMVNATNTNGYTDDYIITNFIGSYKTAVDPLGRGVCTNGGVLVIETRDNGTTAGFCINRGDYFMISPNCTSFKVYIAAQVLDANNQVVNHLVDDVTIYEVESAPKLTNGYLRLCYYNYGTKEIFDADTSITGRDVVRSLLEVCGCFFRLNRFDGLPEFVYPTKGGLYPANTLFPSDELYPRSGTDGLYPMGRYMGTIAEDYEVKDYGRIQILKDAKSNDAVSVCEWEYKGSDSENTYIINDNIFYCADDMMYDYDNMPEVSQMLAGMWGVISNLGYVPNTTEALGSPWIECGDRIGLLTYDGGFESFIFRRTLKGIQNLFDTYESVGDELNEAIDNFEYK